MKKLLLALVIVISTPVSAAGDDELWEIQTTLDVGISIPGVAMPATAYTVCLGKGGAYKPEKFLQEKNCEMTDLTVTGNKTNWKVHCTGENAMDAQGEVIRNENTMSGTIYMSARGMQTNQIISGKRVGTCQQE